MTNHGLTRVCKQWGGGYQLIANWLVQWSVVNVVSELSRPSRHIGNYRAISLLRGDPKLIKDLSYFGPI